MEATRTRGGVPGVLPWRTSVNKTSSIVTVQREEVSLRKIHRGDSRRTFVNETLALRLLAHFILERIEFTGDAITELVERGRYANTRALRKAGREGNATKRKAAVPGT